MHNSNLSSLNMVKPTAPNQTFANNNWRNTLPFTFPAIYLQDSNFDNSNSHPDTKLNKRQSDPFSIDVLAYGLLNCSNDSIISYMRSYDPTGITAEISNKLVHDEYPALFFAISRNAPNFVKLILEHSLPGRGPRVRSKTDDIPALGYTVLLASRKLCNTLEVFKILLAHGANPEELPIDMWQHYLQRPEESMSPIFVGNPESQWCEKEHRKEIARHLTLSHRYLLWKASIQPIRVAHELYAAEKNSISALNQLPYCLVGQSPATKLVSDHIFHHVITNSKKPLVMMFAGPSGHGKTELAHQLGSLLHVETTVIDCAQTWKSMKLLVPSQRVSGYGTGSQLNDFLSLHSGKRSVVVLEEMDKMGEDAAKALFRILDSNEYYDRRTNAAVSTEKTIFIMITNSGDSAIMKWYSAELLDKTDEEIANANLNGLVRILTRELIGKFGAPLGGCCSAVLPFMPFSRGEQAVVAHAFLMKEYDECRAPVDFRTKRLMGHIHLDIQRDEEVALNISETSYIPALGARGIEHAVRTEIGIKVTNIWKENDICVDGKVNDGPLLRYIVQLVPAAIGTKEIVVYEKGTVDVSE